MISSGAAGVIGAAGDAGLTSRRTCPIVSSTLATTPLTLGGVVIGAAMERAAQAKVVKTESDGKYIFLQKRMCAMKRMWVVEEHKQGGCGVGD